MVDTALELKFAAKRSLQRGTVHTQTFSEISLGILRVSSTQEQLSKLSDPFDIPRSYDKCDHSSNPKELCEKLMDELETSNKEYKYLIAMSYYESFRDNLGLPPQPLQPGERLLSSAKHLPGIHSEYAYISVGPSAGAAYEEDGQLPSANLLLGGNKLWVIIHPKSRTRFLHRITEVLGIRPSCDQFLRHESLIIKPSTLDIWNIMYQVIMQRPGYLIELEPFAIHWVLNTGPNLATAINYTPPEWDLSVFYKECKRSCTGDDPIKIRDFDRSDLRDLEVEEAWEREISSVESAFGNNKLMAKSKIKQVISPRKAARTLPRRPGIHMNETKNAKMPATPINTKSAGPLMLAEASSVELTNTIDFHSSDDQGSETTPEPTPSVQAHTSGSGSSTPADSPEPRPIIQSQAVVLDTSEARQNDMRNKITKSQIDYVLAIASNGSSSRSPPITREHSPKLEVHKQPPLKRQKLSYLNENLVQTAHDRIENLSEQGQPWLDVYRAPLPVSATLDEVYVILTLVAGFACNQVLDDYNQIPDDVIESRPLMNKDHINSLDQGYGRYLQAEKVAYHANYIRHQFELRLYDEFESREKDVRAEIAKKKLERRANPLLESDEGGRAATRVLNKLVVDCIGAESRQSHPSYHETHRRKIIRAKLNGKIIRELDKGLEDIYGSRGYWKYITHRDILSPLDERYILSFEKYTKLKEDQLQLFLHALKQLKPGLKPPSQATCSIHE